MSFNIEFHEVPAKIRDIRSEISKIEKIIKQGRREGRFDVGTSQHCHKCYSVDTVVQLLNFESDDLRAKLSQLSDIEATLKKVGASLLK